MKAIRENPFRIIGVPANSTEKEIQKQLSKTKAYAKVGKVADNDYDFSFMGSISRSEEDIQEASNKIQQSHNKLHYSLFWFIKNTPFDEIALNNLHDDDIGKAIEIWEKTLKEKITTKNFSTYQNLSTLYIALSTIKEGIALSRLQKGIFLKGNLINSDYISDLSKLVTGNGLSANSNEISKLFVDEIIELLKPYLNKQINGISIPDFIRLFDSFPESIRKYVSSKFTDNPMSSIENQIEKTSRKRENNPRNAEEYGEKLFNKTKSDLKMLKNLMGVNNLQLQMIINKLANEILQCSIDFFNKLRDEDTDYDPGNDALRIAKYSKKIGATGQTKDRIDEAMTSIQEWVDDKPNRERQEAIAEDIVYITNRLQRFQNLSNSIDNARDFVVSCKSYLSNIKNELGGGDALYLKISSAVVNNALGMVIEVVNREQSHIQYDKTKLITLPGTISAAVNVLELMESFGMDSDVRNRFNTNKRTIKSIKSQLDTITNASRSYGSSSNSSSSGCYIATMAYGDYDHPQVIILRKFRDETLANTYLGRSFISFYYATSPILVKVFKNRKHINMLIRKLLNKFINVIK